jgi:hypothetical protein
MMLDLFRDLPVRLGHLVALFVLRTAVFSMDLIALRQPLVEFIVRTGRLQRNVQLLECLVRTGRLERNDHHYLQPLDCR